jgi:hypothetical protein
MALSKAMADMKHYSIIENFITDSESTEILNFFSTYNHTAGQVTLVTLEVPTTWFIQLPPKGECPTLDTVLARINKFCTIPATEDFIVGNDYRYGSGMMYHPRGGRTGNHCDPYITDDIGTSILRLNVMFKNSSRGANFILEIDGEMTEIEIPDNALLVFNSSDYIHGSTTNYSNETRIIMLTDRIAKTTDIADFINSLP